jgi:predicted ATPase
VYLLLLLGYREASEQLVDLSPAVLKARTVEALRLLFFGTDNEPVILAVEDVHWIDRASEEFLKLLIEHMPSAAATILLTYRPGYRPPCADRSYATQIALTPLSGDESRVVLEATLGQADVPETVADAILRRTEGNPFFLEEMARAVGTDVQARGTVEVPDTIQSVLRARLDRLAPETRNLVQCAAVIGKDVQLSLLQAVADQSVDALGRGLDELQALEFLYRTRTFPDLEYTFKHALTHEVAYGSLLEDRRRALHRRVVETLEGLSADPSSAEVERLAHHAVRGEIWEKAVVYLRNAGTKALLRSASAEAIAYFTRGLDLAAKLPATRKYRRQEMELLLAVGQAHQAAEGFAAAEAEKAYSRARELGQQIGEPGDLFRALWGLWLYSIGRGRNEDAYRIAQELLALAERQKEPALLLEGHHPMWATMLWRGDLGAARQHIEQGMVLYNREQHRSHAVLYGAHDPGVCCRSMSGLMLWLLGRPTSAVEHSDAAIALAQELSHPYSVVFALLFAGMVRQLRRDVDATREVAESVVALSTEHGFKQWLAAGRVLDGWGQAEHGRGEAATTQIRDGIAEYRATGTELFAPYLFSVLAAAHMKHGDAQEGLSAAVQGLELVAVTGQQICSADLLRLKGDFLLTCNPASESQAAEAFRQAIDIARRQTAGSWELRAVTSLARLLERQGARDAARGVLADAYGKITEGADTPDLREAKILLSQLTGS